MSSSILIHNPETVFFGVASLTLLITWLYDYYHYNAECMASFKCVSYFPTIFYFLYFVLIIFWTWIISLLTKYEYPTLSYIAIFAPFIFYILGFSITNWSKVTPTINNQTQYML
jgi:hypothetical protein